MAEIHTLGEVLKKLEAKELIRAAGESAQPVYYLTESGREHLQKLESRPPQRQAA